MDLKTSNDPAPPATSSVASGVSSWRAAWLPKRWFTARPMHSSHTAATQPAASVNPTPLQQPASGATGPRSAPTGSTQSAASRSEPAQAKPTSATTRLGTNSEPRLGEQTRLWFRTERVFFQNGYWYISTREGLNVGPYEDAASARRDTKRLIELLMQKSKFGTQAQALTIQQFMDRPILRNRR